MTLQNLLKIANPVDKNSDLAKSLNKKFLESVGDKDLYQSWMVDVEITRSDKSIWDVMNIVFALYKDGKSIEEFQVIQQYTRNVSVSEWYFNQDFKKNRFFKNEQDAVSKIKEFYQAELDRVKQRYKAFNF